MAKRRKKLRRKKLKKKKKKEEDKIVFSLTKRPFFNFLKRAFFYSVL